ncbi:DUF2764 family protein [candidate division KSB1 bacterium]|nr:DUF2764 family protein [candidate division KSB1 bacterium]
MSQNYYYLVTSLPTLNFGEFSGIPTADLLEKITQNVDSVDQKNLEYLRQTRDIRNLHSLAEEWHTFRIMGNIPAENFTNPEVELELPEDWNTYILSQKGEKSISIDNIWLTYFEESRKLDNPFIQAWTYHEVALRLAIALIRQEKQKSDSQNTIAPDVEKNEHPVFQEILQNRRLPNFGIGYIYDWADEIRQIFEKDNPLEVELALDQIRWRFLDTWIANRHFASDVVLAYSIKLFICEHWNRLNQEKGEQIIHKILGGTSGE